MGGIELKIDCVNIMKMLRNSQASTSNNSCTELNKTQFSPVSIVSFSIILNQMEITSEYY